MPTLISPSDSTWYGTSLLLLLLLLLVLSMASCSTTRQDATPGSDQPGLYARGMPDEEDIPDFGGLFRSVRLLSSLAYYRQADFWSAPGLSIELERTDFWDGADSVSTFTETKSGTAAIVQFSAGRLAVVTAAHVVAFPDTVRSYYLEDGHKVGLKVIAVRVRQENFIPDIDQARDLEILASDDRLDLAILGQQLDTETRQDLSFRYPAGESVDLNWGSLTYVVGFPAGKAMVTSGMVSQPDRDRDHSFLVDVVFNKGMSGAPVLARREGSRRFEWVGILASGSASSEYLLVPGREDAERAIDTGEPFKDDAYASRFRRIRYGVTMAVSIESIRDLVSEQRSWMLAKGYSFELGDE